MNVKQAIEEAKSKSKKRKFIQSIDLIMNFHKIDFSKPENRISLELNLPKGKGKPVKVAVIAGDELIVEAKKYAAKIITQEELQSLSKNKAELKKIARQYDFFIAQVQLMSDVGKYLGQVLGPKGKMPKPVPPNAKLEPLIKKYETLISMKQKGKFLPTIHTVIGTEEMATEDLETNAKAVITALVQKLPNKEGNIRSMFIKTTMGAPIKFDLK